MFFKDMEFLAFSYEGCISERWNWLRYLGSYSLFSKSFSLYSYFLNLKKRKKNLIFFCQRQWTELFQFVSKCVVIGQYFETMTCFIVRFKQLCMRICNPGISLRRVCVFFYVLVFRNAPVWNVRGFFLRNIVLFDCVIRYCS